TAFNFGKNGIRGTAVMRNGKIIQMAGISGIFTGLGATAKGLSTTQSVSPLGTTSTIDPSKALGSLMGNSLESIGSKLSDYYIKLAEQYHPVIELNAGSVVNIVFLRGFSLTPDDTPEAKTNNPQSNVQHVVQLPDAIKNTIKGVFPNEQQ
ncbi:conjugal transfer protein TraB, partial [Photobacterium phosphoreum]|uniref:TrbI/VirB10 family protein n=1 Tax=Photobacterium phosphoreum TaxID=659 RepID=UPI000D489A89